MTSNSFSFTFLSNRTPHSVNIANVTCNIITITMQTTWRGHYCTDVMCHAAVFQNVFVTVTLSIKWRR